MSWKTGQMSNEYQHLCMWPGVTFDKPEDHNSFSDFIKDDFGLTNPIRFVGPVLTSGGRSDVFFLVHVSDIPRFAVKRFQFGIRWWEDVEKDIYPDEFCASYT
jgi:hypothetical protein